MLVIDEQDFVRGLLHPVLSGSFWRDVMLPILHSLASHATSVMAGMASVGSRTFWPSQRKLANRAQFALSTPNVGSWLRLFFTHHDTLGRGANVGGELRAQCTARRTASEPRRRLYLTPKASLAPRELSVDMLLRRAGQRRREPATLSAYINQLTEVEIAFLGAAGSSLRVPLLPTFASTEF